MKNTICVSIQHVHFPESHYYTILVSFFEIYSLILPTKELSNFIYMYFCAEFLFYFILMFYQYILFQIQFDVYFYLFCLFCFFFLFSVSVSLLSLLCLTTEKPKNPIKEGDMAKPALFPERTKSAHEANCFFCGSHDPLPWVY